MKKLILLTTFILLASASLNATVINIPADYPTIQEGLNTVNTMFAPVWTMRFDTVLVSVGYFNNSNFVSKSIKIVLD